MHVTSIYLNKMLVVIGPGTRTEIGHGLIEMSVPYELNRSPYIFDKRNMYRLRKNLGDDSVW